MKKWLCVVVLMGLVSCEPQATPIAGGFSTPTPTIAPTSVAPMRYALNNSVLSIPTDTSELKRYGLVDQLTTTDADDYDVVIGYGANPEWQVAPNPISVGLVINKGLAPLTNTTLADLVPQSIDTATLTTNTTFVSISRTLPDASTIRQTFADNARPDGIKLVLAYPENMDVSAIISELSLRNIEIEQRPIILMDVANLLGNQQAHLIVVLWVGNEQKVALEAFLRGAPLIELYQIPISYRLAESVTVSEFTSNGLPIGMR